MQKGAKTMWLAILIICCELMKTLACRSADYSLGPGKRPTIRPRVEKSFFSNASTWGGWNPPHNDDSWKQWIEKWGKANNTAVDSTEEGRGADSGWPTYWKKLGVANRGVPPPPWALEPKSYGKPQLCFLQPYTGTCGLTLTRWGYNPTTNACQTFKYSGCGGNQNNFVFKRDCDAACVQPPATGCEDRERVNFEELIYL